MARRRSSLSSRTSRMEFPASDTPEWEVISPGVRLGYRRGRGSRGRGGNWLAGARTPDGRRVQARIGRADDVAAADGTAILTHEQAKDAARRWAQQVRIGEPTSTALTVSDALDKYLEARAAEGMKSIYDARSRANLHIRPKLGSIRVEELTMEKVRKWRDDMVSAPKRLRTGKFATKPNTKAVEKTDAEAMRRRRDTANRTLTLFKAALNWARENRLVAGLALWGFGLWWLLLALLITVRYWRAGIPFNLGWWGYTFPLGVYTLATFRLGVTLDMSFFAAVGTMLAMSLAAMWGVVAAKTLQGGWRGNLFVSPCIAQTN